MFGAVLVVLHFTFPVTRVKAGVCQVILLGRAVGFVL